MVESSHSHQLKNNSSLGKMEKLNNSVKLNLPPLSGPTLAKNGKIYRYEGSP